jgi:transcription-repair coupling factor (superfamily II helicase)
MTARGDDARHQEARARREWQQARDLRPTPNVEPLTIIKMIQAQPRVYALDGQDKLRFKMPLEGTAERLRAANDLLSSLGARKAA